MKTKKTKYYEFNPAKDCMMIYKMDALGDVYYYSEHDGWIKSLGNRTKSLTPISEEEALLRLL